MITPSNPALAPVMEVFASIQGEGAYVGEAQVLLRLRGCPLRCAWCDTRGSWGLAPGDVARVVTPEGPLRGEAWATPFQAACWIAQVEPREPRAVSVTGGEPLLWPDFLLGLPPVLGGRRLHLETAGAHPRTLERVVSAFDHVSLDLKLPADLARPQELATRAPATGQLAAGEFRTGELATGELAAGMPPIGELATGEPPPGEPAPQDAHQWRQARRACLELLAHRDAAAKLVVAGGRRVHDYAPLLEDLANLAPELPLFLQPVTPAGGVAAPGTDLLEDLLEDARDLGLAVRVVPQVHRLLGVR